MINKVLLIIKKIVFAFGVLYGINIMLTNIGIIVPINFLTILIGTILGTPGILSLYTLFVIIN